MKNSGMARYRSQFKQQRDIKADESLLVPLTDKLSFLLATVEPFYGHFFPNKTRSFAKGPLLLAISLSSSQIMNSPELGSYSGEKLDRSVIENNVHLSEGTQN